MQRPTQNFHELPTSLARLFQEYDFETMDVNLHANVIMERVLEYGTWDELHWLFHHSGLTPIIEYLQQYGHRRLSKLAFNYWRKLLQIENYREAPFAEIRDDIWRF